MDSRERRRRKRAQRNLEAQFKKAKSEKDTQPTKVEAQPPQGKRYFLKTISTAKVFWRVLAAVLALLGGWRILKPVVHVDPYIQLNPDSPFSERFKVSNDGFFPIYDVEFRCVVIKATAVMNQVPAREIDNVYLTIPTNFRKVIDAAASTTIDCPFDRGVTFPGTKYNSAEIQFTMIFTPSMYFWPKQKDFTFHGSLDSSGNVRWLY
jgi:hypothetical protein